MPSTSQNCLFSLNYIAEQQWAWDLGLEGGEKNVNGSCLSGLPKGSVWLQSIIKFNGYSVVPGRLQGSSATHLKVCCCESVHREWMRGPVFLPVLMSLTWALYQLMVSGVLLSSNGMRGLFSVEYAFRHWVSHSCILWKRQKTKPNHEESSLIPLFPPHPFLT